ncbi:hypothetical protein CLU79DRAFT_832994 [Phycomyces nitens]|nr:hypothetical protein CLU79DRAFT_832994 [Phycomyces nitens]
MVYLGYSTEVIMFQWPAPELQEFLRYHSWRSRLVMMRSVGSDIRLSVLMSTVWNPSYSIEVIIFQWPAPKLQEFSVLPFVAVKAGQDELHYFRCAALLAAPTVWNPSYSKEVIMFQWSAPKRQEFSALPFVAVKAGQDALHWFRCAALLAAPTVWNPSYSKEVIMFQWSAPKLQEFLRYHSRRSRLVMMRSVGSDTRLSVSCQLSGILVDYMDPDLAVLVSVTVEYDGLPVTLWPVFLRGYSGRSMQIMMRTDGSNVRLSLSYQPSGILVDSMDPESAVLVSVPVG